MSLQFKGNTKQIQLDTPQTATKGKYFSQIQKILSHEIRVKQVDMLPPKVCEREEFVG
jgi:hypothetical protein